MGKLFDGLFGSKEDRREYREYIHNVTADMNPPQPPRPPRPPQHVFSIGDVLIALWVVAALLLGILIFLIVQFSGGDGVRCSYSTNENAVVCETS